MMKNARFLIICIFMVWVAACKHEPNHNGGPGNDPNPPPPPPPPSTTCDPDTVYFQNTVLPLFQSYCAKSGCHDVASAKEGVILNNYYNIFTTGDVKPGNPNDSKIYEVLFKNDDDRMPPPPSTALTPEQTSIIGTWISQGALDNKCDSAGCDTANVTYSGTIQPILQIYCTGCHGGASPAYNMNLTSYQAVVTVANTGRLMGAINWETGYFPMPKNGNKLSVCQISQFQLWINNGMPQ